MNDTPETDAFFMREDIDWDMEYDLCRKMERERNEWKEVAEGSLLGAIHERDEAHERASQSINQVGKMLLRIEKIKCDHENECRKLRAGFGNAIVDLQNTIFNLRKDRDKLQDRLELWMDEVEKWRAIANDNRN